MKITMRLYRLHDLDLMYLYKAPDISIQKIIRIVLKSYVKDRMSINGITERIQLPKITHENHLPQSALLHIYLNDNEDKEVIDWITQIKKGCRNSMLKNILRSYLSFPITIPYETDVTIENTNETKSKQSIEDLNRMLNATDKKIKRKTQKKEKDVKPVIDQVLDAPLPSSESKKDVVVTESDSVLNEKKEEETKTETPSIVQSQSNTDNNHNMNNNTEDTTDAFDDFEALMDGF